MNISKTILEQIGIRINKINPGKAEIVAQVESFNPGGSVKDRIGLAMLQPVETSGCLRPGALILEPAGGALRGAGVIQTSGVFRKTHRGSAPRHRRTLSLCLAL